MSVENGTMVHCQRCGYGRARGGRCVTCRGTDIQPVDGESPDLSDGPEERPEEVTDPVDAVEEAESEAEGDGLPSLDDLPHVGPETAEDLRSNGFSSVRNVADADPEAVSVVSGLGEERADEVHEAAVEMLESSDAE